MANNEIKQQLDAIAESDDFFSEASNLTEQWESAGVSVDSVDSILQFMENHPEIDSGTPGPLVHFVEQFHRCGYEEKLLDSIQRKPTSYTVWMLNRLINGTTAKRQRDRFLPAMRSASANPLTGKALREQIAQFLSLYAG